MSTLLMQVAESQIQSTPKPKKWKFDPAGKKNCHCGKRKYRYSENPPSFTNRY